MGRISTARNMNELRAEVIKLVINKPTAAPKAAANLRVLKERLGNIV